MIKIIIYSICFIALALGHMACSGNECAATSDYITDIDSDCVDDSSDNCVGTYNPDQFDGDEDGIGYACDSDDTVDGDLSAPLLVAADFNISGYYEILNGNCDLFSSLSVNQTGMDLAANDDQGHLYEGEATLAKEFLVTGSLFSDADDCQFRYEMSDGDMVLSCSDETSKKTCTVTLHKSQTFLMYE